MIALSRNKIESFRGNILPLHLGFDGEEHSRLSAADIKWSVDGDAVSLREFSGEDEKSFNNGVLIIFNKVGKATVKACLGGEEYSCEVTVREMKKVSSEDELNYYCGDMHDHTSRIHNHEKYAMRESEFQRDYVEYIKNEGLLDLSVVSDHAGVINDTDFFRCFTAAEEAQPMDAVIMPGAESEVFFVENDRLGIPHRHSGEIVTLNSAGYVNAQSWQEFTDTFKSSPEPIGIFAHPIVSGFSTKGLWDFDFKNRTDPEMLRLMRGIELGNGEDMAENLVYEYAYSDALDAGFRISPTQGCDFHGPVWGFNAVSGKTVILAPERSYEAFVDAFRNNRFYATESGNVKLRYSVNGMTAPCDLPLADSYSFRVEIDTFREKEGSMPVKCQVISDGGRVVHTVERIEGRCFEFTLDSSTARYFYLRLLDSNGLRTWSMPVFTGREYDKQVERELSPVDIGEATATDLVSGVDAKQVIDGDPFNFWMGGADRASILIDLKGETEISAVGIYQRILERVSKKIVPIWNSSDFTPGFPIAVEIYLSCDGESFTKCADSTLRRFGSEEIVAFETTKARYLRLDVTETVGSFCGLEKYSGGKVTLGNIAIFK